MLILRAVQSCHVKDVCIHLDKFISHLVEDSVFLYLECDTGCNQGSLILKGLLHLSISLKTYADSCRNWSQQIYTFTFMPTANSNSPFRSKSLYCGRKTEYPEKTVYLSSSSRGHQIHTYHSICGISTLCGRP